MGTGAAARQYLDNCLFDRVLLFPVALFTGKVYNYFGEEPEKIKRKNFFIKLKTFLYKPGPLEVSNCLATSTQINRQHTFNGLF